MSKTLATTNLHKLINLDMIYIATNVFATMLKNRFKRILVFQVQLCK